MNPAFEVWIETQDGESVVGMLMYAIVWEGKALSGGEKLVNGEDIKSITVVARQQDSPPAS